MNRSSTHDHQRNHSLSLHLAYIMVGVVGVIMLVFILNNYLNAKRLNELTSPLWAAIREVKLEASVVQHEATDLLRGEIDPAMHSLWFYLDQSIWHLANLLTSHQHSSRFWLFTEKLDVGDRIEAMDEQLAQLKAFFEAHKDQPQTPEAVAATIMRFDELFAAYRFQLDELETDISRLMLKEQFQQRISYAVLVVFCVSIIVLVAVQIRRYERYRKESYERLKAAQNDLRAAYEFMKIANVNRHIKQMLRQFIVAITSHSGCSACAIRLLSDDDQLCDTVPDDCTPVGCELNSDSLKSTRNLCGRVVNHVVDASQPWFTDYGSYFFDRSMESSQRVDAGPHPCEQARCSRLGYRSLALVPIKAGEQILGMIQIADTREGLISPAMVERMETAAMHVGTAILRLRAEEGLETAYHELENRVVERTRALSHINKELQAEIEERRQIEFRLRENRNTLQTVIDGISDALVLVDTDMQIRMLNRVAADTFKIHSQDNAIGKLCYDKIGPIDACEDCTIPQAVRRGESLTFERQGGADAERLERITIYPVKETDDACGGAIIRICDITEEKRFEQQLIQSEKMASLGILVTSIGHEINNPNNFITFNIPILRDYLNALIGISDQYADTRSDLELFHMRYDEFREDVFKLVDNIEHGASRISNFVSNLREFSQGNGNRERVWLELPTVVDKVLSICRSQVKKRVRDFSIDIPANQPRIYADPYSLEQVLLNLIVNAVQAMDKSDAAVSVSATTGDSWQDTTIIRVADNGCGIDDSRRKRIFNPFYTTKPATEGTGLGLYVCHNLVQRLGGRIEVKSTKGEGSTFTIFLPDKDRRAKARN